MAGPVRIAMYADLTCPYAYLAACRLRSVCGAYRGRVVIEHKSLALEYVNREPTPKPVLDSELPPLMLLAGEPNIPYQPWHRPESEWPVTIWPAFEAVKCAEQQSLELADELDWAIRVAFFNDSRCISMRHVLIDLAGQVGLDIKRFSHDLDRGSGKARAIEEARAGWEQLRVPGSPTLVLPDGRQISDLGLPEIELDAEQHQRATRFRPAPCVGSDCLDLYRRILDEAASQV